MNRHDLPSGGWIEISDAPVPERRRRAIRSKMLTLSAEAKALMERTAADEIVRESDFPASDAEIMYEVNDLVAAAVISDASFLNGRRCEADDICDQPGGDYDAIIRHVAPRMGVVMQGVNFDPDPDRSTPTVPSSE